MDDWTRVLLYGTFDGFGWSTDGDDNILLVLDNGDKVEIPSRFVKNASDFVEKNQIKLKDVIARIKQLDIGTRKVWLDEFLNKLGSDYGTLKYKAGYEQGKVEGLIEREKVTIPQFVADWLKENDLREETLGKQSVFDVFDSLKNDPKNGYYENVKRWIDGNEETFARAWLDGYEVEQEKRYYIRLKNVDENYNYLTCIKHLNAWALTEIKRDKKFRTEHTKKQLEEGGFGEVFDSPLFEVEEVQDDSKI